jgi:hypothetical protein
MRRRYQEAKLAAQFALYDMRRRSLPELIYQIQDLQEDDYYSKGAIGRYYLQLVYNNILKEIQRRKNFNMAGGTIPHSDVIQTVKLRGNITEVLEQFTEVFTHKRTWTYRCTLHGVDAHTSGVIYKDTNSAFCFVCRKGGDIIRMVEYFAKVDTTGAIKWLCQFYGIKPDILPVQKYNPIKQRYFDLLESK